MNSADFQDNSGLNIPGKAFIIVVVVIFSSMSFILGFLVGKNAREKRPEPVAQIPMPSPTQPLQASPQQPAIPAVALPDSAPQTREAKQVVEQKPEQHPEVKKAIAPTKETSKEIVKETTKTGKETTKEVKETAKEVKETDSDQGQQKKESMYTVQLGAIKNKSEADSLKKKYEKKGYTIYISVSKNRKHEKIYKIRIGKFRDRKEADVLALKLKKTDGLNTFVTVTD